MSTLFETEQPMTIPPVTLVVYGKPQAKGSTKAFIPKGWTRPILTSTNKQLVPWSQQITSMAISLNAPLLEGVAVSVTADFYLAKPNSARRRVWPIVKPDGDKLLRAILDSLTGVLFKDDAQVVDMRARKHYGDPERVEITLQAMP